VQVAGSTICILLLRYAAANGLSAACPDLPHLSGEVGRHSRDSATQEAHHPLNEQENLVPAAGCPPDGSEVEDMNVVRREGLSNESQPVSLRPTHAFFTRRGTLRQCARCSCLLAARRSSHEQRSLLRWVHGLQGDTNFPGRFPLYRRPWHPGHRPRRLRACHRR